MYFALGAIGNPGGVGCARGASFVLICPRY